MGVELGPLTLKGKHRLRVFENKVLRGIFGPQRVEMLTGCRKLNSVEIHNLYSSPMDTYTVNNRMFWKLLRMM
jgi:hypothetical protein